MKRYQHKIQKGFTLVELLIGIIVGLVAMAATLSAFISIVRSNTDYLSMIKLNQELNAVMTIMVRDLKRAGYSGTANGLTDDNTFLNPFPATISGNNIFIGPASNFAAPAADDCITFSYDLDDDGNLDIGSTGTAPFNDADERFGYRFDSDSEAVDGVDEIAIEMRQGGNICSAGNWNNITDENSITITALSFDDQSISLTDDAEEEIRYIQISLTGQLKNDAGVSRTLTERVRIRNDKP